MSQPDRLKALLLSPDRPIQLVFAGKAHPADDIGKEMIRQIVQFSRDPAVRHRITFVEDYDIAVARMLMQGSDVWLNTPRRPMEASGTSGEKALLSGALNCSILDGWWAEMFDGSNGWAISSAEAYDDVAQRDRAETDSLFEILESQVVPLFYDRFEGPVPRRWVRRIRSSLITLGPKVLASRMVKDYVQQMYEPIAGRSDAMTENDYARARALAAWQLRVRGSWGDVGVDSVHHEPANLVADLWTTRQVRADVRLGQLTPGDVSVELLHGPVGPTGDMAATTVVPLTLAVAGDAEDAAPPPDVRYEGTFTCGQAGRYGIAVRVVPSHPDLAVPAEMGCITWA
jgi:starch phosphorylase